MEVLIKDTGGSTEQM